MGFILILPSTTQALFDNPGWGARAVGVGGAFVARGDDASAVFWNPAGTAQLKRKELGLMWQRLFPDLTNIEIVSGYFSAIFPTQHGVYGVAMTDHNFGNLLQENIFLANYAYNFGDRTHVGFNIKYLYHIFKIGQNPAITNNAVFENGTAKGVFSFDAGFLIKHSYHLSSAFAVRNINQPNVGLVSKNVVSGDYQVGFLLKPGSKLTLELDGIYHRQDSGNFNDNLDLSLGGERWFDLSSRIDLIMRFGLVRNMSANQRLTFKSVSSGLSLIVGKGKRVTTKIEYTNLIDLNIKDSSAIGLNRSSSHRVGLSFQY